MATEHAALCDQCDAVMHLCGCGDDEDHYSGEWCDDCCAESLDDVER